MLKVLREWSGVLALVLLLAGGTAYAANEWTGANIVNESLTGADMKTDSVRGADVLESSLAKVRSADKLDNFDSTGFVQGRSAVPGVFGTSKAKTYFSRVTGPPGGNSTFMRIPGMAHLVMRCGATSTALDFVSETDGLEAFSTFSRDTGAFRNVLDEGSTLAFTAFDTSRALTVDIQAGLGANTFSSQKLADVRIAIHYDASGDCSAQASALAQGT